jgi:aquaporin Z
LASLHGLSAQLWLFWLAPILGAVIAGLITRWQHEAPEALT